VCVCGRRLQQQQREQSRQEELTKKKKRWDTIPRGTSINMMVSIERARELNHRTYTTVVLIVYSIELQVDVHTRC